MKQWVQCASTKANYQQMVLAWDDYTMTSNIIKLQQYWEHKVISYKHAIQIIKLNKKWKQSESIYLFMHNILFKLFNYCSNNTRKKKVSNHQPFLNSYIMVFQLKYKCRLLTSQSKIKLDFFNDMELVIFLPKYYTRRTSQ